MSWTSCWRISSRTAWRASRLLWISLMSAFTLKVSAESGMASSPGVLASGLRPQRNDSYEVYSPPGKGVKGHLQGFLPEPGDPAPTNGTCPAGGGTSPQGDAVLTQGGNDGAGHLRGRRRSAQVRRSDSTLHQDGLHGR